MKKTSVVIRCLFTVLNNFARKKVKYMLLPAARSALAGSWTTLACPGRRAVVRHHRRSEYQDSNLRLVFTALAPSQSGRYSKGGGGLATACSHRKVEVSKHRGMINYRLNPFTILALLNGTLGYILKKSLNSFLNILICVSYPAFWIQCIHPFCSLCIGQIVDEIESKHGSHLALFYCLDELFCLCLLFQQFHFQLSL